MKAIYWLLAVAVGGCASTSAGTTADAPVEACNVAVSSNAHDPWRLVRADGFTFCVPSNWTPTGRRSAAGIDPRSWRAGRGSLNWDLGEVRRETGPYTVARDGALAAPTERRFTETIAGDVVEFWTIESTGAFRTGAVWTTPMLINFTGYAPDLGQTELQLNIFRTVRFTPR